MLLRVHSRQRQPQLRCRWPKRGGRLTACCQVRMLQTCSQVRQHKRLDSNDSSSKSCLADHSRPLTASSWQAHCWAGLVRWAGGRSVGCQALQKWCTGQGTRKCCTKGGHVRELGSCSKSEGAPAGVVLACAACAAWHGPWPLPCGVTRRCGHRQLQHIKGKRCGHTWTHCWQLDS